MLWELLTEIRNMKRQFFYINESNSIKSEDVTSSLLDYC